jgi:hypothetical protein
MTSETSVFSESRAEGVAQELEEMRQVRIFSKYDVNDS